MTRLKELAIKDLDSLSSTEMIKLYDFIQIIKDGRKAAHSKIDVSYLKVREALQGCSASLSQDILLEREERI